MGEGLFQPMHLLVIFADSPGHLRAEEASRTRKRIGRSDSRV